jgi:pyrroloquinoline quinone (PQQ) biosynthesis protein C
MEDLGLKAEQLPNFRIHREADTDHKSQTLEIMEKYATSSAQWEGIVDASRQSFEFWQVFLGGVARAMEEVN